MLRKIIQYFLWAQAKLILWRYQPLIIAVTGSTGKSSTKEAIYYALKIIIELNVLMEILILKLVFPSQLSVAKMPKPIFFYGFIICFILYFY